MFAKGRVALVTGAGGVIGREVALGFLREGVNVAAVDMSAERLEKTVADAKELSGSIMTFKINVANKNECMKLVESIVAEYGRVDILANVAGVMINETIRNVTEEHWDLTQEVNVKGPLYLTQAVFEHMKAQKYGRIINVCSPAYKGGFWPDVLQRIQGCAHVHDHGDCPGDGKIWRDRQCGAARPRVQ